MDEVEISLSTTINQAVIRVPGRKLPGVVIQGDTLSGLLSTAEEIVGELHAGRSPMDGAEQLTATLTGWDHYERTMATHGMPLPYVQ